MITSKQTFKQTSKQTNKQASEQASKHTRTHKKITHTAHTQHTHTHIHIYTYIYIHTLTRIALTGCETHKGRYVLLHSCTSICLPWNFWRVSPPQTIYWHEGDPSPGLQHASPDSWRWTRRSLSQTESVRSRTCAECDHTWSLNMIWSMWLYYSSSGFILDAWYIFMYDSDAQMTSD